MNHGEYEINCTDSIDRPYNLKINSFNSKKIKEIVEEDRKGFCMGDSITKGIFINIIRTKRKNIFLWNITFRIS